MKPLKIKFHPLFWLLGIFMVLTGNAYMFIAYVFTAVIHEYAHSFAASFVGVRSNEIILYPYGAVLYGKFSELKPSDEIIVAIAGPLINLFAFIFFTALWWLFPVLYAYTDLFAAASIYVALFNLLPVYPFDGGRVVMSILRMCGGEAYAFKVVKILGFICCAIFAGLYIYTIFNEINYSLLFTAFFMLSTLLTNEQESISTILVPPTGKRFKKGVEKKIIRVSKNCTVLQLLKLLSVQYHYVIEVVEDNGKIINKIDHSELENLITKFGATITLDEIK